MALVWTASLLGCAGLKFSADDVVGAGRSKFVVREEMLPDFIGHMRSQIFNAGKFLTVLRSCELPIEAMLRDADGQQVSATTIAHGWAVLLR